MDKKVIDNIVWWIPFKGLRNSFRELMYYFYDELQNNLQLNESNHIQNLQKINNSIELQNINYYELLKKLNNLQRYNDILSDMILYKDEKKIFILDTAEYGNLGDSIIVYSMKLMLEKIFPNRKIIEYTDNDLLSIKKILYKFIKEDDIIFMSGGGNLGNIWIDVENIRRDVIKQYKNNKIIIFPQSIHFTDDEEGIKELEISKKIYNEHNNLTIMLRDNKSYELAAQYFKNNNIRYVPDIALSLFNNINIEEKERNGVIFLLRNDKEKVIKDAIIESIKVYLDSINEKYIIDDNVMEIDDISLYKLERENMVLNQLENISNYRLCITDRLHAVISSYVTNTPCLALASYYDKIKNVISCLQNQDSIYYVDNDTDINTINITIDKYLNKQYNKNNIDFNNQILEIVKELCQQK